MNGALISICKCGQPLLCRSRTAKNGKLARPYLMMVKRRSFTHDADCLAASRTGEASGRRMVVSVMNASGLPFHACVRSAATRIGPHVGQDQRLHLRCATAWNSPSLACKVCSPQNATESQSVGDRGTAAQGCPIRLSGDSQCDRRNPSYWATC
jgi:hypothetical protein